MNARSVIRKFRSLLMMTALVGAPILVRSWRPRRRMPASLSRLASRRRPCRSMRSRRAPATAISGPPATGPMAPAATTGFPASGCSRPPSVCSGPRLLGLGRRRLCFHAGYWGPHVGFYGGVNYGFGYGGVGFVGGRWEGGHFAYNTAVMNVNRTVIHNTYVENVHVTNVGNHTSFNGGPGGIKARPDGAGDGGRAREPRPARPACSRAICRRRRPTAATSPRRTAVIRRRRPCSGPAPRTRPSRHTERSPEEPLAVASAGSPGTPAAAASTARMASPARSRRLAPSRRPMLSRRTARNSSRRGRSRSPGLNPSLVLSLSLIPTAGAARGRPSGGGETRNR